MDRTYVLLLPTVRFRCLKLVIGCLEADFAIYFRSKTCNHECIFGCRHTCIYRQTDRETDRPGEAQAEAQALGPSPARQADRQADKQTDKQTVHTLQYITLHSIPFHCAALHYTHGVHLPWGIFLECAQPLVTSPALAQIWVGGCGPCRFNTVRLEIGEAVAA